MKGCGILHSLSCKSLNFTICTMLITIELANIPITLKLKFDETSRYFSEFLIDYIELNRPVSIKDEDLDTYPLICPDGILRPYSEMYMLMARVSEYLLKYNRVLFHGVSFIWKDKAWIITAPSGTGKTTQYLNWKRLYKDEIEIINGDKSVLEVRDNHSIWVHTSPWKGKEGFSGTKSAELGGLIILQQESFNSIERIGPNQSVLRIFSEFLIISDTEEEVRSAAKLESLLLNSSPVWLLENTGDESSAKLTHNVLAQYLEEINEKV